MSASLKSSLSDLVDYGADIVNQYLYSSVLDIFQPGTIDGALYSLAIDSVNQTSTGTTPVTVATDPIGLMMDTRFNLAPSTKGAYLSGAAGTYLSSPDSVPASITGDIDLRIKVAATDWTKTGTNTLIGKWQTAGQYSFLFYVLATGELGFVISSNGTAGITAQASSAATGFTDGSTNWVRVTRVAATGAVNYYTSSDGTTWNLLGSANRTSTAGGIFEGTSKLELGTYTSGTGAPLIGKIYEAQIYNGINGTLAVNYKGTDYVTGTTLTSSTTGEVWTINGAAYIAPDGNHARQATAAARPTWEVDAGGHYYLSFLGTDDSLTSATGGGGDAGFFWCGVVEPTGGAGTLRTIWADNGTNTGYKIQLDTSNKLSFSAGNNTAFTTLASTATVTAKSMITVRDNGTNLSVQIGTAAAETVARPVVVAGTAGYTIGKDNGAASSFAIINKYPSVYAKDTGLTDAEVASVQAWVKSKAGL